MLAHILCTMRMLCAMLGALSMGGQDMCTIFDHPCNCDESHYISMINKFAFSQQVFFFLKIEWSYPYRSKVISSKFVFLF